MPGQPSWQAWGPEGLTLSALFPLSLILKGARDLAMAATYTDTPEEPELPPRHRQQGPGWLSLQGKFSVCQQEKSNHSSGQMAHWRCYGLPPPGPPSLKQYQPLPQRWEKMDLGLQRRWMDRQVGLPAIYASSPPPHPERAAVQVLTQGPHMPLPLAGCQKQLVLPTATPKAAGPPPACSPSP